MNTKNLRTQVFNSIWESDLHSRSGWQARIIFSLRIAYAVIRDAIDGQITLRAMSLVYTTLLSLVPLLAVSFSVLKAFGVHNQIEPMLLALLQPLGDKSIEITERIIGFVENMKAGVLGSLGLLFLLYTVVSLIQKIERAFNFIWRVKAHRSFTQRFSDYLSVVIVGPIMIFTAVGITASIASASIVQQLSAIEPFGEILSFTARLAPYLLIIAAFTFVYVLIPNTKVKIRSALIGAITAGILWETTGWAFASFVASSGKYTAIYSAFATLIIFMIWLYLAWLILLTGTSIAFYHQHPEYLSIQKRELKPSNRMKESLALHTMYLISKDFHTKGNGWSVDRLAQYLHVPMEIMEEIIDLLINHELLKRTCDDTTCYQPSQSLENIMIEDVINAVRSHGEESYLNLKRLPSNATIDNIMNELEQASKDRLDRRNMKDLVLKENNG
ncbi:MAG: YihY/virulence factor BrkB family protein [Gammaproteobacteria bacterium]|nr:YihY/virulence factor BrkB family protein [Gammaproteobacteria bacterium]MDH5614218.1 YihY/virulence factor BrkB family protein [Gammaproteobacteria bacterium]